MFIALRDGQFDHLVDPALAPKEPGAPAPTSTQLTAQGATTAKDLSAHVPASVSGVSGVGGYRGRRCSGQRERTGPSERGRRGERSGRGFGSDPRERRRARSVGRRDADRRRARSVAHPGHRRAGARGQGRRGSLAPLPELVGPAASPGEHVPRSTGGQWLPQRWWRRGTSAQPSARQRTPRAVPALPRRVRRPVCPPARVPLRTPHAARRKSPSPARQMRATHRPARRRSSARLGPRRPPPRRSSAATS